MNAMLNKISMLLFAVFAGWSCGESRQPEHATTAAPPEDSVAVMVLHNNLAAKKVELPAEILPFEQAPIFARVEGYVRELKVDMGDRVTKGQLLAVIEAPELQTRYAEYQAELQAAKARLQSSSDAFKRLQQAANAKTPGIVAPIDLEKSRNQYLADSAAYEAAIQLARSHQQVAGYLQIRAPFSGVITSRDADRGSLVGVNHPLFALQDNSTLRLRIAVPEQYVSSGAAEQELKFRVDAFPSKYFTAKLYRKSEAIDPQTRTETWEYLVDNKQRELKAGAFAYAALAVERKDSSFFVPASAIVTNQERRFVLTVKQNKINWTDVRTGLQNELGTEIFGELQNGDTILIRGSDERKPGTSGIWKVN